MVTRRKGTSEKQETKGKVKVDKLKLSKETIKQLTSAEKMKVKGGAAKEKCKTFNFQTCL